jgi:tight adherence protein B
MASANNPEPLASELRFIIDQVRVGVTLPLAIEAMYRRVPVEELGFLASAVSVQADSGSSLAEILEHVSQSIRYRQRLDDQIRTLTSQSRSSAMIVSALPAVVLGVFSLLRADYVRVLFTNPLGVKLLEAAIVLDFLAFVIMRRIAQVDF